MSTLETLRSLPAVEALGWALLHFVWQGAAIAVLVAAVLWLMRGRSANARYLVACAGMALMIVAPAVTVVLAWPSRAADTAAVIRTAAAASAWSRFAPFLPAMTAAWLAGVLLFQIRLVLNWSHAQHLKRFGVRAAPEAWQETMRELAARMGVSAPVRLLESTVARVPMMIGWLHPVILVPTSAWTGLTPDQLRTIIAHELTHVRRHDYIVNLVQTVLETLLFYHPAVWWLTSRIRIEREYCCDDAAVRVCGDALCYAKALSSLEELRSDEAQPILASTGGSLMNRILRITGVRPEPAPARRLGGWLSPTLIAASVTVAVSAMAVSAVPAEEVGRSAADAASSPAIDRVPLLAILREHEFEQTDMIAFLAESGVDNGVLVSVLEELEADERIMDSINRAEKRVEFVDQRLPDVRKKIAAALAAGKITITQAETHLDLARRELTAQARAAERGVYRHRADVTDAEQQARAEAVEARLHEIGMRIKQAVEDGTLTADEARAHYDAAVARVKDEARAAGVLHRVRRAEDDERQVELMRRKHEQMRAELEAAVAAGKLTKEEAHEKMERADRHLARIHEELEARREKAAREHEAQGELEFHPRHERKLHEVEARDADRLREEDVRAAVAKFEQLKADLTDEVAAGRITEAEAKQKLVELHHALQARHFGPKRRERSARRPMTVDDRQALAAGLVAARKKVEDSLASGAMTEDAAAKRLEHLTRLEAKLAQRTTREEGAVRERRPIDLSEVHEEEDAPVKQRKRKPAPPDDDH
jgi:beta-lactamase regulating signal transducer with metallopeptidase domain